MGEAARNVIEPARVREIRARLAAAVDRVCPAWLRGMRDDIVQTATMRIVTIIENEGEGDERFTSSYLWRVAYNATIDEIRRLRSRHEVEMPETTELPAESAGPDDHAVKRELAEAIVDCVGGLVEARRVAVTLYLQGHAGPESARILGWDAKRVENLVYRGLADLRDCLSGKGHAP